MSKPPSYEELLGPHGPKKIAGKWVRGGRWVSVLRGLIPGEVRVVDFTGLTLAAARTSMINSANRLKIPVAMRTHDGVLYVVRLKDEDVPE